MTDNLKVFQPNLIKPSVGFIWCLFEHGIGVKPLSFLYLFARLGALLVRKVANCSNIGCGFTISENIMFEKDFKRIFLFSLRVWCF